MKCKCEMGKLCVSCREINSIAALEHLVSEFNSRGRSATLAETWIETNKLLHDFHG